MATKQVTVNDVVAALPKGFPARNHNDVQRAIEHEHKAVTFMLLGSYVEAAVELWKASDYARKHNHPDVYEEALSLLRQLCGGRAAKVSVHREAI